MKRQTRKTHTVPEVSPREENKAKKKTDRVEDVEICNEVAGETSLRGTFQSILEGS